MRKLLLIVSVLAFSLSSCGQDTKDYYFQDIGLHIKVPRKYVIQDNFPKVSFLDTNGRQITDTAILQELQSDLMKGLLVVSLPDRSNTISFNLAMQTAKTGDFETYYNFSKGIQHLMAQQTGKYDTVSSVLTAGKVNVYKFMTLSTETNPVQYSGIYLAHVKKYFLVIKADFTDKKFGEEIENVILSAKFD